VTPKPATLAQVDAITEAMPEGQRLMVLLATWCAMRFGELVELRRGDVNVKDGVVSITRGVSRVTGGNVVGGPKSHAGVRDVAIPPHILPAVVAHLKGVGGGADTLLFPAKSGRHLQPSTFYRITTGRGRRRAATICGSTTCVTQAPRWRRRRGQRWPN
jgi:integrase